jgi:hypothetical protein
MHASRETVPISTTHKISSTPRSASCIVGYPAARRSSVTVAIGVSPVLATTVWS